MPRANRSLRGDGVAIAVAIQIELVTRLRSSWYISRALDAARGVDRPSAYLLEYALHVLRRFATPSDADHHPTYAKNF